MQSDFRFEDDGPTKSDLRFNVGGKDACVGDSGGPLWYQCERLSLMTTVP